MYADWFEATDHVDGAISVDPKDGLRLLGDLFPLANTEISQQIARSKRAVLHPDHLKGDLPLILIAGQPNGYGREILDRMSADWFSGNSSDARVVRAFLQSAIKLTANYDGIASANLSFGPAGLSLMTHSDLRQGTTPKAFVSEFEALMTSPETKAMFGSAFQFSSNSASKAQPYSYAYKRLGNMGLWALAPDSTDRGIMLRRILRQLISADVLEFAAAPKDNGVTMLMGGHAGERLKKLITDGSNDLSSDRSSQSHAQTPAIMALLEETEDDSGFIYFDILGFAHSIAKLGAFDSTKLANVKTMMMLALSGSQTPQVPLIMKWRGGASLLSQLVIPQASFETIGKLIAPFTGGARPPAN